MPRSARSQQAPAVLDIDSRKQLLIDDYIIENLAIEGDPYFGPVLNQPLKCPHNPVLRGDRPWETHPYLNGAVIRDEDTGGFRMWYMACNPAAEGYSDMEASFILYAESRDGIAWHKPNLGRVEFRGSKNNNILLASHGGVSKAGTPYPNIQRGQILYLIGGVLKDTDEPDNDKRYKLGAWDATENGEGFCVAVSPNGLQWTWHPDNPVYRRNAPHDVISAMYDTRSKKFIGFPNLLYDPSAQNGPNFRLRHIGRSESPDFVHWTEPPEAILAPDECDYPPTPPDAWEPCVQFYGMAAFNYEDLYIGLLSYFRNDPEYDDAEIQLVVSRDGRRWQRAGHRQTFIPKGPRGTWDQGMVMTTAGSPPVAAGDDLYFYYGGWNGPHANWCRKSGVGLATLRRDGFVSIDARHPQGHEGILTTRLFTFAGDRLVLNADAQSIRASQDRIGYIQVEIQRPDGKAIPGYSQADCDPFAGDRISHIVTWKDRSDVRSLQGKPVRLAFYMKNAKLFAFQFLGGRSC